MREQYVKSRVTGVTHGDCSDETGQSGSLATETSVSDVSHRG